MSKLSDKIRSATQIVSQPLGFGAAKAVPQATMVLAGYARDGKEAAEQVRRGADVIVLAGARPDGARDVAAGTAILGAAIGRRADDDAAAFREGGFDFVTFDPETPATALLDEKAGYVLVLPKDLEESEIRTLEAFQLDAIDVGPIEGALTVRRQIELRRIYAMTRKPLLAHVRGDIAAADLQALRDTNVVVVAAEKAEDVERLRKTIDALPPRRSRRDDADRPTPLVPRATATEDADEEDGE